MAKKLTSLAMNEALLLGVLRQHEMTETAETLNVQLQKDIAERIRAEDALRVSETRYRRLFEPAHDGVLILDPDTRRITDANPFVAMLLGCSRDRLVGKELFEIGLLKNQAASREMFRQLKIRHEICYVNLSLASFGGRLQQVEVVVTRYQEDGHPVIQCNIRDITERMRSEDTLRRNEALFSALIGQAPVGVYVVDAGFRLQQANSTAMESFGGIHPLIGRDFSEIFHILWPNQIAGETVARFRHTLETGEPYHSPGFSEQRRDTGEQEVYEWQIQRVTLPAGEFGLVCFFNDITERIRAETAQHELDVLTRSNLKLNREIIRRRAVEESLHRTEQEQTRLLKQSHLQQAQLRDMSHQILHAQEVERKRISRELHDVIAQTLVGINIHLVALAQSDTGTSRALQAKIVRTHRMVEKAVEIVHRFACELRPTVLNDLGLIPALQAHLKSFMNDTGIRASLKVFAGIENTPSSARTALYRIAQEALTNVSRHAKASQVSVSIEKAGRSICMEITDDGRGFEVEKISRTGKRKRLGLLGMRERVEMIGGTFQVDSTLGQSTTIRVKVPLAASHPKKPPANKTTQPNPLP
jgi:PAS domain S-box-containing protein